MLKLRFAPLPPQTHLKITGSCLKKKSPPPLRPPFTTLGYCYYLCSIKSSPLLPQEPGVASLATVRGAWRPATASAERDGVGTKYPKYTKCSAVTRYTKVTKFPESFTP